MFNETFFYYFWIFYEYIKKYSGRTLHLYRNEPIRVNVNYSNNDWRRHTMKKIAVLTSGGDAPGMIAEHDLYRRVAILQALEHGRIGDICICVIELHGTRARLCKDRSITHRCRGKGNTG